MELALSSTGFVHPDFKELSTMVEKNYIKNVLVDGNVLFLSSVSDDEIWNAYLSGFPEEHRQYYNCSCCRNYVTTIGKTVYPELDGSLKTILWDTEGINKFFIPSFVAMQNVLKKAPIEKMFYFNKEVIGIDTKGNFDHFCLDVRVMTKNHQDTVKSSEQYFQQTKAMLETLNVSKLQELVNLFEFDEKLKNRKGYGLIVSNLMNVKNRHSEIKHNVYKDNLIWGVVGTLNFNLINFNNNVCGEFLKNLIEKPSLAVDIFLSQTSPDRYMRPEALPTEQLKERAEKIIKDLNAESALKRRICNMDDILEFEWKPAVKETKTLPNSSSSVFDVVMTKEQAEKESATDMSIIDGGTITMLRFMETVVPKAKAIELFARDSIMEMSGLSTAVDSEAAPIIRWDSPNAVVRNPVSTFAALRGDNPSNWGVSVSNWHEVQAIICDPSDWFTDKEEDARSYAFVLRTDMEMKVKLHSCLFPEILRPEFFEIRKVIEQFSLETPMLSTENPIVTIKASPGNNISQWYVKVTTETAIVEYVIDRYS